MDDQGGSGINMQANNRALLVFFYFAFFLSGFAGLIYESQWTHYLKLFLGHAAYAQAMVLCLFMGGMFIGAWLIGRISQRINDPLKWYFFVELGICLFGACFHYFFVGVLDFSYNQVIPQLAEPWQVYAYKYLICIFLITPQTILLGMTFPLMVNGILRRYPQLPGNSVSLLYCVNSAGAAIGVLVAAFILIERLGLPGTMLVATGLNFLVSLIVVTVLPFAHVMPNAEIAAVDKPIRSYDKLAYLLLFSAMATGCASFAYEIGWIRMLSMVLGSSTQAFELMLSAFITGLALGSLFIRFFIERLRNSIYVLALIQIVMGIFALTTIMLYGNTFYYMRWLIKSLSKSDQGYTLFMLMSHSIALFIMLPTTIFAGMTLPLMTVSLLKRGYGEKSVGDVYSWNMIGSILGVLLAISVGLPYLGLKLLINVAALLDIVTGIILLISIQSLYKKFSVMLLSVASFACVVTVFFVHFDPMLMSSGIFRYGELSNEGEIVYQHDGRTATVSVKKYINAYTISTNGKPDASVTYNQPSKDDFGDGATEILLAAYPLAIAPDIKTVAVIGFGSGTTSHVLLTDSHLQRVDTIEIEPSMVEGARQFKEYVKNVFSDPRSNIIFEDAKTFFATRHDNYDLIISEPSNPWVSGTGSLFTVEFYQQIKRHLNDQGYLVQWFHLYENNDRMISSVFNAIGRVFENYQAYSVNDGDIIIIASENKIPYPSNHIFNNGALNKLLANISVYSVEDLNFRYIGDADILKAYALFGSAPINSDYYPFLSLNAPKARFLSKTSTYGKLNEFNLINILQDRPRFQSKPYPFMAKSQEQADTLKMYKQIMNIDDSAKSVVEILLANPKFYCKQVNTQLAWLDTVFSYMPFALAYLDQSEQKNLWGKLTPNDCVSGLSSQVQALLNVVFTFSGKDYAKVFLLSRPLLSSETFQTLSQTQQLILIKIALISDLKLGKYESAINTYRDYISKLTRRAELKSLVNPADMVEINLLFAYASVKEQEKLKSDSH